MIPVLGGFLLFYTFLLPGLEIREFSGLFLLNFRPHFLPFTLFFVRFSQTTK